MRNDNNNYTYIARVKRHLCILYTLCLRRRLALDTTVGVDWGRGRRNNLPTQRRRWFNDEIRKFIPIRGNYIGVNKTVRRDRCS